MAPGHKAADKVLGKSVSCVLYLVFSGKENGKLCMAACRNKDSLLSIIRWRHTDWAPALSPNSVTYTHANIYSNYMSTLSSFIHPPPCALIPYLGLLQKQQCFLGPSAMLPAGLESHNSPLQSSQDLCLWLRSQMHLKIDHNILQICSFRCQHTHQYGKCNAFSLTKTIFHVYNHCVAIVTDEAAIIQRFRGRASDEVATMDPHHNWKCCYYRQWQVDAHRYKHI